MNKSNYSWLFPISCWGMLSVGITFGSLGPLLLPISDTFQLGLGQIALPVVSYALGFLTANVFVAFFWRIHRARFFLTISSLITFLTLVSISLFHTPVFFFTLLFLLGVAQGVMHTSLDSLLSEISGEERAKSLNWLHVFIGIGAVVGPLLVGALLTYTDRWYLTYFMMAIIVFPLLLLFSRTNLYSNIINCRQSKALAGDSLAKPTTSLLFWLAMVGIFTYVGLELSFASWIPIFLVKVKNISYTLASYSISIFWLALMTGRFLFGRFFHRTNLSLFIGAGALVAALFTALTFSTDYFILMGLFMALSGLLLSWFYPTILALGADAFPKNIGFVTGSLAASGTMGSILFPWMIGPISEASSLTKGVFLVPLLCLVLAGIFFCYNYLLKRKH